jgi:hemerythrin superfamily protein
MDALDLLEQQHRDVARLLDGIAAEPSPGQRTALVVRAVRAIEAHSRAEERCFYPAFRERTGEDARLYEIFEQHALLRFAAENLLATRVTDLRFPARLKLLRELCVRHAAAEEDWAFPKAKRNLCDEDLDRLGSEVARAHEVLLASGVLARTRSRAGRRAPILRARPSRGPRSEPTPSERAAPPPSR